MFLANTFVGAEIELLFVRWIKRMEWENCVLWDAVFLLCHYAGLHGSIRRMVRNGRRIPSFPSVETFDRSLVLLFAKRVEWMGTGNMKKGFGANTDCRF